MVCVGGYSLMVDYGRMSFLIFFEGYCDQVGVTCKVTPIKKIKNNNDVDKCAETCNYTLDGCIGFTYYDNGDCRFRDGTCQEGDKVQKDDVIIYVQN